MVDDYAGYKALFPRITELACWAHARRVFFDATPPAATLWPRKHSAASARSTPSKPNCATWTTAPGSTSEDA